MAQSENSDHLPSQYRLQSPRALGPFPLREIKDTGHGLDIGCPEDWGAGCMLIEGPMMHCAECPTCHVFTILHQDTTATRVGPGEWMPGNTASVLGANPFCRESEFPLRDTERRVFRVSRSILTLGYFVQGDITEGRVQEPNR